MIVVVAAAVLAAFITPLVDDFTLVNITSFVIVACPTAVAVGPVFALGFTEVVAAWPVTVMA